MKKWIIPPILISVLAAAAFFVFKQYPNLPALPWAAEPTPTPPNVSLLRSEQLESLAHKRSISEEVRNSLQEKVDLAQSLEAQFQNGKIPVAKEKMAPNFQSVMGTNPYLEVEPGIYPGSDGMVKPSQATVNNYWQGVVGDRVIQLFAGSVPEQEDTGRLVLLNSSLLADGETDITVTDISEPTGSLTIDREVAGVVYIQSENGSLYLFDLASLKLR